MYSNSAHHCDNLGPIDNSEMEGRGPFTCISTVKYMCNEGYWLLGPETLKCKIGGQWNQEKPVCIDNSKKCINV